MDAGTDQCCAGIRNRSPNHFPMPIPTPISASHDDALLLKRARRDGVSLLTRAAPGSALGCSLGILIGFAVLGAGRLSAQDASGSFEVRHYVAEGSSLLTAETVDRIMSDATGKDVSLPKLRRSLLRLQQAYRDAGLTNAGVVMPRQRLADGVVRLRVFGGFSKSAPAGAPSDIATWLVPSYEVRHFVLQGNSVLSPEEIDRVLGPAAGEAISPGTLEIALRELRAQYAARGYSNAVVRAPSQLLVDGTVSIVVNEGTPPPVAASTNAVAAAPSPSFEVRRYEVAGNTLLSQETIDRILASAIGEKVGITEIRKALGELQLAYRERGWATVSVGLPQQQLTNAVVKVQVVEGSLVDVQVAGNKHFSSNNIIASLPSLKTNALLNSRVFQRELDIANQNRDRQIYPVIGPGPEPGTSALTLRVKDRLPLHGRIEVNNVTMAKAPEWRVNTSASFNNLWQKEHQVGINYSFSPERFSDPLPERDFLFNRPLIASYGAYYRLPFGDPQSVEDALRKSTAFGFDEATRQFRLPPAGSRPDAYFFGNAAKLDTGAQFGPSNLVSSNAVASISTQDSGQNVVAIEAAGGRVNYPLALSDTKRINFSAGLEVRRLGMESYNTNNFVFVNTVTNSSGPVTTRTVTASGQPPKLNDLTYLPISAGIDFSSTDKRGATSASLGLTYNLAGDGDQYDSIAYSKSGNANFAKATLFFTREQKLPKSWSVLFRAGGQVATGPLIFNEQFSIGGINTVRGYFEGEYVGDTGWNAGAELRTPQISFKLPVADTTQQTWVRGIVFMDFAQLFQLDSAAVADRRELWGTGFGVSASINNAMDLKITVGWPLLETANSGRGEPRATVSIGGQF
jgi:hemolysin activation/secretion protein